MARIRSTHPEQWCDEDFVELSFPARLMCIALRNFCDDKGIFEWKPKKLTMQIFPADAVDCTALLEEMASLNIVRRFEVDGRAYGAVRNFRKFQRPKKPNSIHPADDEILAYVGINAEPKSAECGGNPEPSTAHVAASSPPVENQFPTASEIAIQMEDGGCNSSLDDDEEDSAGEILTFRDQLLEAIGVDHSGLTGPSGKILGTQADMAEVARWLELPGLSEPIILDEVRAVMARKRDGPPGSFRYFTNAMQTLSGSLARPALKPISGGRDDQRTRPHHQQSAPEGRSHGADAALANIARLAGLSEAPG